MTSRKLVELFGQLRIGNFTPTQQCRYYASLRRCYQVLESPDTRGGTLVSQRCASWYNRLTANEIWKGVVAVTGKAQTKARGKRPAKRIRKDLNKGQFIGDGKLPVSWPGLNSPVLMDNKLQSIQKRELDPFREEKLQEIRERWDKKRRRRVAMEDRGWTSKSWGGRHLGPPDPIPGETFEGFDSCVLHMRRVFNMVGSIGRKRSMSALVVVGNKNGAVGVSLGKAPDVMSALRKAKNRAASNIQYIERYDDHTIFHDIESKFNVTRVRMKKQNKGHGLRCHRVIQEICKLAGIKDIHAKVYGCTNPISVTNATMRGLLSQETHQQIADRKGLHVVEFREECGSLPIVVASPKTSPLREDVDKDEWPKELPLEYQEEKPAAKKNFSRPGVIVH
ncbi:small ribosomal subunit protein uS5m-like isoform X1 [Apostichopus japonicus]|uniref:small ribosomal subunit protein uS5m-like isoform X1 n=1 Tax=Stichopus japonicus TaxID=307972 RepID=UPI003AB61253